MDQSKEYLRIRNALNPHRDSKPPYQNEMVHWNDGYDKGYSQAKKESAIEIEKLKLELLAAQIRLTEYGEQVDRLQMEINARSQIPQDKKDL